MDTRRATRVDASTGLSPLNRRHSNRKPNNMVDSSSDAGIEIDFGSQSSDVSNSPSSSSRGSDEVPSLDQYLICPYCKNSFHEPKLLPCGHTICLQCVNELVNSNSKCAVVSCDEITTNSALNTSNTIAEYLSKPLPTVSCEHQGNFSCKKCRAKSDLDVINNLKTAVREIRRRLTILLEEKKQWATKLANLDTEYDYAKIQITEIFDDLSKQVENRRKERLNTLAAITTPYSCQLRRSIRTIDDLSEETELLREDVRRLSQHRELNRVVLLRTRLRYLGILSKMETLESQSTDSIKKIQIQDCRQSVIHHMDTSLLNNIKMVLI